MSDIRRDWASLILVCAAVATVGLLAHREFATPGAHARPTAPGLTLVDSVPGWDKFVAQYAKGGLPHSRVVIVEFADLQCPFCRRFQRTVREMRHKYGDTVAFVFVHFTIPTHRFAPMAAHAAECAAVQDRFDQFIDATYGAQDSLGLKPWRAIAAEAGVGRLDAFDTCLTKASDDIRVDSGKAFGQRLGVRGTPTLLINGWRLSGGAPSDSTMDSIVRRALTGRRLLK
jgi:protein-disulfide isomerase